MVIIWKTLTKISVKGQSLGGEVNSTGSQPLQNRCTRERGRVRFEKGIPSQLLKNRKNGRFWLFSQKMSKIIRVNHKGTPLYSSVGLQPPDFKKGVPPLSGMGGGQYLPLCIYALQGSIPANLVESWPLQGLLCRRINPIGGQPCRWLTHPVLWV